MKLTCKFCGEDITQTIHQCGVEKMDVTKIDKQFNWPAFEVEWHNQLESSDMLKNANSGRGWKREIAKHFAVWSHNRLVARQVELESALRGLINLNCDINPAFDATAQYTAWQKAREVLKKC